MRTEWFIAKRLYFDQDGQKRSSRPAIRVALLGIVIGVMVMVLTICIVVGFKQTVADKVACFGAHIQVTNFDSNNTFEMRPIIVDDTLIHRLQAFPHVEAVETFLTKPGIIKTEDNFQGIVLKSKSSLASLQPHITQGRLPENEREVLFSERLCSLLQLHLGDPVYCYFVGDEMRVRKFTIAGIYSTGFQESDELFVWCYGDVISRLNAWDSTYVSGLEIRVDDIGSLEDVSDQVWYATANHLDEEGGGLFSQNLKQLNPQIFAWLDLLDMNVVVIILLMLCVSGFNIISGLIILILDSIQLIGTLKALGANNTWIRRVFVLESTLLIGKGVLWGNGIGLGIALLQYYLHLFSLDPATYYVDYVPIAFPVAWLLVLNIGVIIVSVLILLAPSVIVSKISPAQVMHFE